MYKVPFRRQFSFPYLKTVQGCFVASKTKKILVNTAELQWLERLWKYKNMFESGKFGLMSVIQSARSGDIIIGVGRGGGGGVSPPPNNFRGAKHILCPPPHLPNNPPTFAKCLCETVKTRSQLYQLNIRIFYFV